MTCHVLGESKDTAPCAGGILGHMPPPPSDPVQQGQLQPRLPDIAVARSEGDVGGVERRRRQDYPPLPPALTRAVPSLMWAFPRAGVNSTQTWTDSEPLLITPSKNYTAFDMPELLRELDVSPEAAAQLAYLSSEPVRHLRHRA